MGQFESLPAGHAVTVGDMQKRRSMTTENHKQPPLRIMGIIAKPCLYRISISNFIDWQYINVIAFSSFILSGRVVFSMSTGVKKC